MKNLTNCSHRRQLSGKLLLGHFWNNARILTSRRLWFYRVYCNLTIWWGKKFFMKLFLVDSIIFDFWNKPFYLLAINHTRPARKTPIVNSSSRTSIFHFLRKKLGSGKVNTQYWTKFQVSFDEILFSYIFNNHIIVFSSPKLSFQNLFW